MKKRAERLKKKQKALRIEKDKQVRLVTALLLNQTCSFCSFCRKEDTEKFYTMGPNGHPEIASKPLEIPLYWCEAQGRKWTSETLPTEPNNTCNRWREGKYIYA